MSINKAQIKPAQAVRSVAEVMDEALMREGWTREQLDAQRRTGDIIAELMAEDYSEERLDAELQRRLSQEELVAVKANGAKKMNGQSEPTKSHGTSREIIQGEAR